MKLSVVIPAHNEEECISTTLSSLVGVLNTAEIDDYEILVIADHCTDTTEEAVSKACPENDRVRCLTNPSEPGFGMAVRHGLDHYTGDVVGIFMADASDDPADLVEYMKMIEAGAECVFGSRFMKGGEVVDYPIHKLILNRIANWFVRVLFMHGLNDTTNAFKCYRREVIDGCRPFLSVHFNLTVELPLKAIIRGYQYEIIPITWHNRQSGVSKLKIKEMGSRYLFVVLYCFLERILCGTDYRRCRTKTSEPRLVNREKRTSEST